MSDLRSKLIRVASALPKGNEERRKLLALLDIEAATYEDYLKRKKREKKRPLSKDEWEARTQGGEVGGATPSKAKDKGPDPKNDIKKLRDQATKSKSVRVLQTDKGRIHVLPNNKAIIHEGDTVETGDIQPDGSIKNRKPVTKSSPTQLVKRHKKYHPNVAMNLDRHDLLNEDAEEVKTFKKTKPPTGIKLTDAQLFQRFLQKAKPETRERMKDVPLKDFLAMYAAIMDEEE